MNCGRLPAYCAAEIPQIAFGKHENVHPRVLVARVQVGDCKASAQKMSPACSSASSPPPRARKSPRTRTPARRCCESARGYCCCPSAADDISALVRFRFVKRFPHGNSPGEGGLFPVLPQEYYTAFTQRSTVFLRKNPCAAARAEGDEERKDARRGKRDKKPRRRAGKMKKTARNSCHFLLKTI